jgi:hypothetical protein
MHITGVDMRIKIWPCLWNDFHIFHGQGWHRELGETYWILIWIFDIVIKKYSPA